MPAHILAAAHVAKSRLSVSLDCSGGASLSAMGRPAMLRTRLAKPMATRQADAAVIMSRRIDSSAISAVREKSAALKIIGLRKGRPRSQRPAGSARKNVAMNRWDVRAAIAGSLRPFPFKKRLSKRNCDVTVRFIKNCPATNRHTLDGNE